VKLKLKLKLFKLEDVGGCQFDKGWDNLIPKSILTTRPRKETAALDDM
jgi:hypothetical protein